MRWAAIYKPSVIYRRLSFWDFFNEQMSSFTTGPGIRCKKDSFLSVYSMYVADIIVPVHAGLI